MSVGGESKDTPVELTALVVLGWILPLAGFLWGPGEWWAYAIWITLGTLAIVAWEKTHPRES